MNLKLFCNRQACKLLRMCSLITRAVKKARQFSFYNVENIMQWNCSHKNSNNRCLPGLNKHLSARAYSWRHVRQKLVSKQLRCLVFSPTGCYNHSKWRKAKVKSPWMIGSLVCSS